ncbi:hypothetical protein ILUMI_06413, partial [Ignelater luminosus]
MAGMLSVASRNVPRPVLRIIKNCLERSICETPLKERAYHHSARTLRKAYVQAGNLVLNRYSNNNLKWLHQIRCFKTSPSCWDVVTVNAPTFPDSVSEGDLRWQKKVGDHVSEDEVIAEIETDKTSIPVPSPGHGIIKELLLPDGSTVQGNTPLFKMDITGEKPTGAPAAKAAAPPPPAAKPAPPPPAIEAATVKVPPKDPTKEIAGTRTEHRVKMNRMRQKIAQRLKQAQNINAMLTTFNEIDMSAIMEFRKANLDPFMKKYGIKLGFMSAFAKAAAYALQDQPVINAVIDDSGTEIIYRDYVDISVAVATPKGLVVPVLRNVDQMNYAEIEQALNALGEKARKGALAVEDMDGGTFTISNGGVFGSLSGTPIINPPQSAILGMHAIFDRPVAIKGQ